MPRELTVSRRVQFYETDLAGVVHFSWYLRYMEEAEHALWREAGLTISDPNSDIGYPRVAASVEFLAPLHFEDVFDTHIRIETLGKRSITYACTITRGDETVATGTMKAACVLKVPLPMRSTDIPDDTLQRLR
jgi:acyl-CoA thioester hydrolase